MHHEYPTDSTRWIHAESCKRNRSDALPENETLYAPVVLLGRSKTRPTSGNPDASVRPRRSSERRRLRGRRGAIPGRPWQSGVQEPLGLLHPIDRSQKWSDEEQGGRGGQSHKPWRGLPQVQSAA